jgi:uncharacterized protein YrrD
MLRSLKELERYSIGATDGLVGHVKDLYFDDRAWVIRYLIVDTGAWLSSRKVLISPFSIREPDTERRVFPVSITKQQVKDSPSVDTEKPVSRQHEIRYLGYYGYPYYWGGAGLWGEGSYPAAMLTGVGYAGADAQYQQVQAAAQRRADDADRERHEHDDPHLRSCEAIIRYHIHASDGEIGHVENFLIDDQTWAVRYFVVNTSNWWVGHSVLIAPQWIERVSWGEAAVTVNLTQKAVQEAPPYDPKVPLGRETEIGIYKHYGRPGYWSEEQVRRVA